MQANEVLFAGYAGGDAVVRTAKSGAECVAFRLCHTKKQKDGSDESTWCNVEVWGNWVSTARLIKKGANVLVKGSLKISQYKKDGRDITYVSIVAFNVGILEKPLETKTVRDDGWKSPEWPPKEEDPMDIPF